MSATASSGSAWASLMDVLTPLLSATVGALLTLFISARVQKQKDIDLRVWDLKRVGYSVVVAKLGEALAHAERLDEGYNELEADPDGFALSKRRQELDQKLWDARTELQSEFRKSRLTCSEAFVDAFRELDRSLTKIGVLEDYPPDRAASVARCLRTTHAVLLAKALEELGLESGSKGPATKAGEA